MSWAAVELEVSLLFASLTAGPDEMERALEVRRLDDAARRKERVGMGRSRGPLPPLAERLHELKEYAERHFRARSVGEQARRPALSGWATMTEEQRKSCGTRQRRMRRERERELLRALRASRPVADLGPPVGRPAWLEKRFKRQQRARNRSAETRGGRIRVSPSVRE